VVKLLQPGLFADPLTEVLRNGARALLAQAVEAELAEFLAKHIDLKTASGLGRVVRHGHLHERAVMTGIGPVSVRQPRVRDRGVAATNAERIRFTPAILPSYARRSRSLEVLIPILYLKGLSTGDFEEALAALLGKDAPGLSASTIARLKEVWIDEHEHWRKRALSAKHYVYVWADGIYLQARLADAKQCILVIIGATPEGRKELLGFTDGARESAQDWRELLLDLKNRGLVIAPELAVADGALGFWKALGEGTVRNFVRGWAVQHDQAIARVNRSPKRTANWALAMHHSRGGMIHSFSERFKTRKSSFVAASSVGK
jgi:transposase-like protein